MPEKALRLKNNRKMEDLPMTLPALEQLIQTYGPDSTVKAVNKVFALHGERIIVCRVYFEPELRSNAYFDDEGAYCMVCGRARQFKTSP